MNDFFDKLDEARKDETKIARYLLSLLVGASGFITPRAATLPLFDFGTFYKNRLVTFELKTDHKAGISSRKVFVETSNARTGKPSGLGITAANRMVLYVPAQAMLYSFRPQDMRDFLPGCKECDYIAKAGDGNAAGYLVPLDTLERIPFTKRIPYDA